MIKVNFKMINIFSYVIYILKITLLSRPKLFWWKLKKDNPFYISEKQNFGDLLGPYIINKLCKKEPLYFSPLSRLSKFYKHSMMVGSIIGYSNNKTIVWGSGIISSDQVLKGGKFLAVRGPRTLKRILELGFKPPKVIGDPALLLPCLYDPRAHIKKKYSLGIIPHYVDYNTIYSEYKTNNKYNIINLMTNNVEFVIDEILKCDFILSSSLHGIICAHAYGIPAIWWQYSAKLAGDNVKFFDYFESVQMFDFKKHVGNSTIDLKESDFISSQPSPDIILKLQKNLLSVFPYKIKKENILFENGYYSIKKK